MESQDVFLRSFCCPKCRGQLLAAADSYNCGACGEKFRVISGIVDFRPKGAISNIEKEYENALKIAADIARFGSFRDYMEHHIKKYTLTDLVPIELVYELYWRDRSQEILDRILALADRAGWGKPSFDSVLDVGSGKGAFVGVMSPLSGRIVGIEYQLRYCLIAQKLLSEVVQKKNAAIACASADALPFKDESFDLVTGVDIIEHLPDQKQGLSEMNRVVRKGGFLFLTSPNRFNLFRPEDHVNIYWVGFWPRKLMPFYTRLFNRGSYSGIWPLSLTELRRLLNFLPGKYHIEGVMIQSYANSKIKSFLKKNLWIISLFNCLMRFFLPLYNVLYRKKNF